MPTTRRAQPRSRAPRGSLNREAIVVAALDVVERGGPDALTMRNVAAAVGAKPMSLYNHVDGRDDLLDALFELVLAEVTFPTIDRGRWQDHLYDGWSAFRDALRRRPVLLPLVFARRIGPSWMRATEHSLALLRNAGLDAEQALHAHRLLSGATFGAVMNESSIASIGPFTEPSDGWPMLTESAPYLVAPDFDAAWEFAISSIIRGLEAQLEARQPPAKG